MVVIEEEPETDSEDERDKANREHDYMTFRRNFDQLKRDNKQGEADSEKLKSQGNQFFSLGLYEQASMMYSEALDLQPKNAVLFCNRSMAYLKLGLADQALEDAEKSLAIDSEASNIKAYWRKAQALLDLQKPEEAEEASNVGLELQPANGHLNSVRRKAREAHVMRRLSAFEWVGKLEQGVEKRMVFNADGTLTMWVFNHPLRATFDLSVEGSPWSMYLKMKDEGDVRGTGPPPPPVPYIFQFQDGDEELWICHPVMTPELPTKFEGPGFISMRRAPKEANDEGPLDERVTKYIEGMCDTLPLMPQQLPARLADDEIQREVQIAEKLASLKRKYGLEVHQRAVELAKEPEKAGNPRLRELARGLHKRFVARQIIPMPALEERKAPTVQVETAPLGCLAGIVARMCNSKARR